MAASSSILLTNPLIVAKSKFDASLNVVGTDGEQIAIPVSMRLLLRCTRDLSLGLKIDSSSSHGKFDSELGRKLRILLFAS